MDRVIASKTSESREVLIVLIGSLHGNEKEGVEAINRVFHKLSTQNTRVNGKIIGIAGNLQAIAAGKRYLVHDLNRCWTLGYIEKVNALPRADLKAEDKELVELHELLNKVLAENYSHKFVIDLHTTSADNGNFLVYPGTIDEKTIARQLGLPLITNLDDYLEGTTLLKFYSREDTVSFAFEGGQIGSPKAVAIHEEGIWKLLQLSGLIPHDGMGSTLKTEEPLPSVVRVVYRHGVKPEDAFKMEPNFRSFQPIKKGELIAKDKKGPILSPCDGLLFMPLYQEAGNDGFFVVEEV